MIQKMYHGFAFEGEGRSGLIQQCEYCGARISSTGSAYTPYDLLHFRNRHACYADVQEPVTLDIGETTVTVPWRSVEQVRFRLDKEAEIWDPDEAVPTGASEIYGALRDLLESSIRFQMISKHNPG